MRCLVVYVAYGMSLYTFELLAYSLSRTRTPEKKHCQI